MANYNRYQYETSPRKLQPEYKPVRKKYPKKSTARKNDTKKQSINIKENENRNVKPKTKQKRRFKPKVKVVIYVMSVFAVLFAISYRNSLINENFSKIKALKSDLAVLQKENGQLEISIENSMNLQNLEQSAKELLGMQKLDSSQSVYVKLPKEDYVEPATEEIKKEEKIPWYQKILNLFMGK